MIAFAWTLALKILPWYGLGVGGYIGGRFCDIERNSIARILFYILAPIVVFHGAYTTTISRGTFFMPLYCYAIPLLIAFPALKLGRRFWHDGTENIFAFGSAAINSGYFGIPVITTILGDHVLPTIVLGIMGLTLFECTVGYYLTARGAYSVKESIRKLLTVPSSYGFIAGILLHIFNVELGNWYTTLIVSIKGAYGVLGFMMIGLAASRGITLRRNGIFLTGICLSKLVVWPLCMQGILFLDRTLIHALSTEMASVLTLLSFMPIAANTIVLSTTLNVQPEKAAAAVLVSSTLAFISIPLMVSMMGLIT